ncbi:hypothetical protein JCM5353_008369 [Sporobolomyces roseus]
MRGNYRPRPQLPTRSSSSPLFLHRPFFFSLFLLALFSPISAHSRDQLHPRSLNISPSHPRNATNNATLEGTSDIDQTSKGSVRSSGSGLLGVDVTAMRELEVDIGIGEGEIELGVNLAARNRTTTTTTARPSTSSGPLSTTKLTATPTAVKTSSISISWPLTLSEPEHSSRSNSSSSPQSRTSARSTTLNPSSTSSLSSNPSSRSTKTSSPSKPSDSTAVPSSTSTRSRVRSTTSSATRSSHRTKLSHAEKPSNKPNRHRTSTHEKSTPRSSSKQTKSKSSPGPTSIASHTPKPTKSTKSSNVSKTTKAKPSPTSFGFASKKGCVPPAPSFQGHAKGFSNLCTVRYCDVKPRRNMVWSGLDGDVTREEIESALGMLQNLSPVWENGQGNILGDGELGQGAYSASLLFEVTGDIRALDVAVRIADNILALQNQNTKNPFIIWTGEADPVWPTHELPPNNKADLIYAGCEQGEIVSNMVNSALLILKSPCLWDMVPPSFKGPTVFNETATYYDRALAYIAAGDDTYENYFFRFVDSAGSIIQPADNRWWAVGDSRDPGTLMPWNRRMQIVHGALKLAAAHETPAAFNSNLTKYYDDLVQRNVMDFLGALNTTRGRVEGMDIFNWDYSAMEEHTEESKGIHALYDILGSWRSWQRSSATYYLSDNFGKTMADTFQYQINLGNGSFAGLVTGQSTIVVDVLFAHWSFYGFFLPEWYRTVATSLVDHGFQGRTYYAIPLLWTKHAIHMNDLTFWTGLYSSGYNYVIGTEGKTSSSAAIQWSEARTSSRPPSFAIIASILAVLITIYISS